MAKLPLSNPQILDGEGGRVLDAPAGLHGIAASNVSLARLNALQVRSRYQRQRHRQLRHRQNRAGARRLTEAARTDHHFSQRRAHATRLGRGASTQIENNGNGRCRRFCGHCRRRTVFGIGSVVTLAVFFLALWLLPFETFTPFPFPRFPGFP